MHDFRYVGSKLFCEGVAVDSLAEKFGTPLYIYSQRTLTEHFRKLDSALSPLDHLICFAMKANSNLSVMRVLANLGSGFDVVSAGELQRVIVAGGDPRKCVFAGRGQDRKWKSNSPCAGAFIRSMCESEPEIVRINRVAGAAEKNRAHRRAGQPEHRGRHARQNHHGHLRK